LVISAPQKQRARSFFVCVGSFRLSSCIRYFQAAQSRFWRHSSKCASVRVDRSRFHASSNSTRASSNVSPVPLVCCPGIAPGGETAGPAPLRLGERCAGTQADVADVGVAEVDEPALAVTLVWPAGKFSHTGTGGKVPVSTSPTLPCQLGRHGVSTHTGRFAIC
jgi:hypothetical protein